MQSCEWLLWKVRRETSKAEEDGAVNTVPGRTLAYKAGAGNSSSVVGDPEMSPREWTLVFEHLRYHR